MSDCCSSNAKSNGAAKSAQDSASSCCSSAPKTAPEQSSCCAPGKPEATSSGCCPTDSSRKFDWLLWGSATAVTLGYLIALFIDRTQDHSPLSHLTGSIFDLINTMWWSMILAAIFVGILGRIPQHFVISVLGKGGSWQGLWRATLAGVLLDLCSHGILMVGMQLYNRGASLGQVMAFLIASPWNSLSLTLILIALVGLPWTMAFILLSVLIALVSGRLFDLLVASKTLPANPHKTDLPENFAFWPEARKEFKEVRFSVKLIGTMLWEGVKGSRMVLRWLLFGVVLASLIRTFVEIDTYQALFGPTLAGLGLTLLAATIIEVCSEGSTPIAADLLTRAGAPGNSFAFLMTGVATDYTEVMSIKDTTQSWKIALFLPLVTVPQVVMIAWLLNNFG